MKKILEMQTMRELEDCPDLSWLENEVDEDRGLILSSCRYGNEDVEKYGWPQVKEWIRQDRDRLKRYRQGDWYIYGIWAEAKVLCDGTIQTLRSSGLWGVESDSDPDYLREVEEIEISELSRLLARFGFKSKAVKKAMSAAMEAL